MTAAQNALSIAQNAAAQILQNDISDVNSYIHDATEHASYAASAEGHYAKEWKTTWIDTQYGGYNATVLDKKQVREYNAAKAKSQEWLHKVSEAQYELDPGCEGVLEQFDAACGIEVVPGDTPGSFTLVSNATSLIINNSQRSSILEYLAADVYNKIAEDAYEAQIKKLESGTNHGASVEKEINQDIALEAQFAGGIDGNLADVQSLIYDDESVEMQQEDAAETRLQNASSGDIWAANFANVLTFGLGGVSPADLGHVSQDEAIIQNAKNAIAILSHLANTLASNLQSFGESGTIAQLENMISEIGSTCKAILANPGSAKGEVAKLLPLMMELLGIFRLIQQEVESQKAKFEQQMEKAQIHASTENIENVQANATAESEEISVQQEEQTISIITTVVSTAVFALMANPLAAAVITTAGALQVSGVFSAWESDITQDLENDGMSKDAAKIVADVIMTVAQVAACIAATLAGNAIASSELLMSITARTSAEAAGTQAVEEISEEVEQSIERTIEEQLAGRSLVGMSTQALANAAKDETLQVAKQAAEAASRKVALQIAKQSVGGFARSVFNGEKAIVENAATSAAREASKAIQEAMLKQFLAGNGIALSEDIVNGIIEDTSNQAASSATGKSVEQIAKEGSTSALKSALKGAAFGTLYGIGSTNLLVDIATWALHHDHKSSVSTSAQALMISMAVIQGLVEMLGTIGGTGALNQAAVGDPSTIVTLVQRASAFAGTGSQIAEVTVEAQKAAIDKKLAVIQEAMQENEALGQTYQTFGQELTQNGQTNREAFIQLQQQELRADRSLVNNYQSGVQTAIQILSHAV